MTDLSSFGRLRSLLFAPAVRPDFLDKLPQRGADAVVIDCEDATPAHDDAKATARQHAASWAPRLAAQQVSVVVRVNAVPTAWFADDIATAVTTDLTALIIPKLETLDQLEPVRLALEDRGLGHVGVMAGLETALGVADARRLLAHRQVNSAYFGAEDFIADMGGVRTESNAEVHYARSQVALAARLAGVPVLDQIVADFSDDDRFVRECRDARSLGYDGKLCIHPRQVELANEQFLPAPDEVERARRLLEAYDQASAAGVAAIDFEGQMVDEPLARQARRIVALANGQAPND